MFKQEFEWLTSNTHVAYPFVERVANPLGTGPDFSDLVVDAFVSYPGDKTMDIRLSSLTDPSGTPSVVFLFDDNSVAFTSTGGSTRKSVIGQWTLVEWVTGEQTARLLLKTDCIGQYTWPVTLTDAKLVGHAIQPTQSIVNTLGALSYQFSETIELVAGYNVKLTKLASPSGTARGISPIRVDVDSGLGVGQYPVCESDTLPLLTINGIGPDQQGNFIVKPVDCYRVEIPVTNPTTPPYNILPNTLLLFNDCSPCCDCNDYIHVYNDLLRNLYAKAKFTSVSMYAIRDKFDDLINKWAAEAKCRSEPTLEVRLTPIAGYLVGVQIIVRNNGCCCATGINIAGTIESGCAQIVPGSSRIDGDTIHGDFDFGAWPAFSASYNGGVYGGRTIVFSFWINLLNERDGDCNPLPPTDLNVSVTATGTLIGCDGTKDLTGTASVVALPPYNRNPTPVECGQTCVDGVGVGGVPGGGGGSSGPPASCDFKLSLNSNGWPEWNPTWQWSGPNDGVFNVWKSLNGGPWHVVLDNFTEHSASGLFWEDGQGEHDYFAIKIQCTSPGGNWPCWETDPFPYTNVVNWGIS